jgi:hypothetical protein
VIGNRIPSTIEVASCPICNGKIVNGVCERHGTICETCGTLYKDPFCPNCYSPPSTQLMGGSYYRNRGRHLSPNSFRLGELGMGAKEFSSITGRQLVTKKESDILRAAGDEESARKRIREKTEAAIRWLTLPRSKEMELIDVVERNAVSLSKACRREARLLGQNIHISPEKVVEYALLREVKRVGRTIREVQYALAKAGFNIKLQLFCLRIAVTAGNDIASVRLFVNDWKRDQASFRPKEAGAGPIGKEYTVSVQTLLADTIDDGGKVGERTWIKVHFENAVILSDESAVIVQKGENKANETKWYSSSALSSHGKFPKKSLLTFDQKDPQTVWLKLNAEKCFALFKDMNRMLERSHDTLRDRNTDFDISQSVEIEGLIRQHLCLPSKKFPASASLLQRASCLAKLERRSVELFREFLRNSEGRSLRSLAHDAVMKADREIYSSLSPSVKFTMKGYISTLPLRRRDRNYTGVKGLLIPSEFFRD